MDILTPLEIAQKTEHLDGAAATVAINALFLAQDSSPFNFAGKAIENIAKLHWPYTNYVYAVLVDAEISDLVNAKFDELNINC